MRIYAFSDEASSSLTGQIAAMKRNGLDGMEIRGVDGQNVAAITREKAAEVLRMLKDNGLAVWSVGSPIGKIPLDGGGFEEHLDSLKHVLEIADVLECRNIRMFSFYMPEGAAPESCRGEVLDRLGKMAELASGTGIALCHLFLGLEKAGKTPRTVVGDPGVEMPNGVEYVATVLPE